MSLSKNKLLHGSVLAALPRASQYWVAYSGGVDSHVLLHLLAGQRAALPGTLAAVHIDHQILPQSGDWAQHCSAVCEKLDISIECLRVNGRARSGESPEAAARTARYRALRDWLPRGAVLLTAQHQDDQAETLLLQLFRGAGPRGLAAMPENAPFGRGRLLRPFLALRRATILAYAQQQQLRWVEDPSNTDTRYDRNLLRHAIMPRLQQHWPGVSRVLARAASHQADQIELADTLAALDYRGCAQAHPGRLSLAALRQLSAARQRNLIRYWLALNDLPRPPQSVLERIRSEQMNGRADADPLVHWPGAETRRFRDTLYAMQPLPRHDPARRCDWDAARPLVLDDAGGVLSATPAEGQGLWLAQGRVTLEVRFRQGGETLQPAGREYHHELKKLFQEWGVPAWERARVPLLYSAERLVAVAGLCVCEGFQCRPGQRGLQLHWSRLPET